MFTPSHSLTLSYTPRLSFALTPGLVLALAPGLPLALAPGLPLALAPGLLLGPQPYNPFVFGPGPKARVATSTLKSFSMSCVSIVAISGSSSPFPSKVPSKLFGIIKNLSIIETTFWTIWVPTMSCCSIGWSFGCCWVGCGPSIVGGRSTHCGNISMWTSSSMGTLLVGYWVGCGPSIRGDWPRCCNIVSMWTPSSMGTPPFKPLFRACSSHSSSKF